MAESQHNAYFATARNSAAAYKATPQQSTNPKDLDDEEQQKRFTCLYFGYASNLSPRTMKQRCPDSLFISLGLLKGWRWIINETGYATIVPGEPDDEVWGSLSFLSFRDEMALDESEGVPWAYQKVKVKVKRIVQDAAGAEWKAQGAADEEVEVTTYVDVERQIEGRIEREYVVWIKKGIADARPLGMPEEYAEKYIKRFLPEETGDDAQEQEIAMVRTMRFGERDAGLVPRGFASWDRG